jgi:hypothetical protein
MRAPLWLKMLRRWPELRVAVEENADRPRSQQERNALEIRKAEAAAWSNRSLY